MSEVQKEQVKEVKPYTCKPRSPIETFTELGSKWHIRAKLSVNDKGEQVAEPGDKVDWNAYIQSSKKSTDIASIVARAQAGDESVLNVNPNPFYGDVDLIPSSVNDVKKIGDLSDAARESFDKLPDELKAAFGSSEDFFNAVLNNKADQIAKEYFKAKEQASKAEEKESN